MRCSSARSALSIGRRWASRHMSLICSRRSLCSSIAIYGRPPWRGMRLLVVIRERARRHNTRVYVTSGSLNVSRDAPLGTKPSHSNPRMPLSSLKTRRLLAMATETAGEVQMSRLMLKLLEEGEPGPSGGKRGAAVLVRRNDHANGSSEVSLCVCACKHEVVLSISLLVSPWLARPVTR